MVIMMMSKQCLISKIVSKKFHFTIEQEDHENSDEKKLETFIDFETLEQKEDKQNELFEYMDCMVESLENPDVSSYYHDCHLYEDFLKKRDARLVIKYGNEYKPHL